MNRKLAAIAAGVVVLGGAVAALFSQASYREVTERPAEKPAPAGALLKETSVINLTATLPYETVTAALNAAVPKKLVVDGRRQLCGSLSEAAANAITNNVGGDGIKVVGWIVGMWVKVVTLTAGENKCFDGDYAATISRPGDFVTGLHGDALHIEAPFEVVGTVGLAGDGAKAFGVDKKNVRGKVLAYADIKAQIDKNWCPTLQIAPGVTWTQAAQVEVMERWWMDIDSQATEGFKKGVDEAQKRLPELLTCDFVKGKVQPLWHQYTFDIPKKAGVEGAVTATPRRVGLSGIVSTPKGIQLSLMLEAETEVKIGKQPPPSGEKPELIKLPDLEQIPAGADGFKLSIPLTVDYPSLQALASKVLMDKEKPFEFKSDLVQGRLDVEEVKVWPAGEHAVIGVKFRSKLSRPKSLAPQGWVYIKTKLKLDPAAQVLKPVELSFSRVIDNDLWNAVSYVFQDLIKPKLEKELTVDLKKEIAELQAEQRKSILESLKKGGFDVDLKDRPITVASVEVLEPSVRVLVRLEGSASVVVLPSAAETAVKELIQMPTPPPPALPKEAAPREARPQQFDRTLVNPSARTRAISQ